MLALVFILFLSSNHVLSASFESISKLGSLPPRMASSTLTYSEETNQIFLFGGILEDSMTLSNTLYAFNLSSISWEEIIPQSLLRPAGLFTPKMFLGDEKNLVVFHGKTTSSVSSDVFSFDLPSKSWSYLQLEGDDLPATFESAYCEYKHQGSRYFAVFGGISNDGVDGNLFIISISELTVRKVGNDGESPDKSYAASLSYYSGLLYLYGNDQNGDVFVYDIDLNLWNKINTENNLKSLKNSFTCIMNDTLFVFFGYDTKENRQIIKFSIKTQKIDEENNEIDLVRSAFLLINDNFYVFGGVSQNNYENSLYSYQIREKITPALIHKSLDFPPKRKNHAIFALNNIIYIFGGRGENDDFLNDFWKYDVEQDSWIQVQASGNIPQGRELMGYYTLVQGGFLMFGGRTDDRIFGDAFYFAQSLEMWIDYSTEVLSGYSRYSTCLCASKLKFIIIGGRDNYKIFLNILVYDFLRGNVYVSKPILPEGVFDYNCYCIDDGNTLNIYIFGGRYNQGMPYFYNLKLSMIVTTKSNFDVSIESFKLDLPLTSEHSVIYDKNYFYLIGGSLYRELVINTISKIRVTDMVVERTYVIEPQLGIHSHRSIHLGDQIYTFGGGLSSKSLKVSLVGSNSFYKLKFNTTENVTLTCNNGMMINGICQPCKAGTYFNSTDCLPCPKGRYSKMKGVSSANDCIPCGFGTFSDKLGSTMCKQCMDLYYCPVGSSMVRESYPTFVKSNNHPQEYQGNSESISETFNTMCLIGFPILFFIITFAISRQYLRKKIEKIDIFVDKHSQVLTKPIIHRKTLIGGIFSFFFILFAIFMISRAILSYQSDNIYETRALIPQVVLKNDITAEFLSIEMIYYAYGGSCINSSNICTTTNNFTIEGINCSKLEKSCNKANGNCYVNLVFTDFSMVSDSKVLVYFEEQGTFASLISINISVSSSIPDKNSETATYLRPAENSTVLKGSIPNQFYFEMIPSVKIIQLFSSESSKWPSSSTGFHIFDLKSHVLGSVTRQELITTTAFLLCEIHFKYSHNAFMIQRKLNFNFITFFSSMVGSVFGFLEIFGWTMGLFEGLYEKLLLRRTRKIFAQKVKHERGIILSSFWPKEEDDEKINENTRNEEP